MIEATKRCAECGEDKLTTAFYRDNSRRDGVCRRCKSCDKTANAAWHASNRAKVGARAAIWAAANPEKRRAANAVWAAANPGKKKIASASWVAANPARAMARVIARRNRLARQTPAWANLGYMNLFYKIAKLEQVRAGQPVHVDHIFPLSSAWVCGLHCEQNMQLLFATHNLAKSNRPDGDYIQSQPAVE